MRWILLLNMEKKNWFRPHWITSIWKDSSVCPFHLSGSWLLRGRLSVWIVKCFQGQFIQFSMIPALFPGLWNTLCFPQRQIHSPGLEIARSLPRLASGCVLQCGLLFNQIRNLARFCCFSGVCAAFRTGGCCMPVHYLTRARHTLLLGALQSCWVPQFSVWQRSAIIYICLLLITSPGAEIYQPDLERICA